MTSSLGFAQQAPKAVNKGNAQVAQAKTDTKRVDTGAAGASGEAVGGVSLAVVGGVAAAAVIAASSGNGSSNTTGTTGTQ